MKIKGWKHILSFTYLQTLKSKGFKVSTVVTCVLTAIICAAINILPVLLSEDGGIFDQIQDGTGDDTDNEGTEPISVNTLYIYSDLELDFEPLPVEGVEYLTDTGTDFDLQREAVIKGDKPEMLLYIYYSGESGELDLTYYCPENKEVLPKVIARDYADRFTEAFTQALYLNIGVDEAHLPLAQADIYSFVAVNEGVSWVQEIMNIVLPMAIALIFYVFIVAYSQQIAQSMATEKSSRVIELLITSARPLAIITGKIAGTLLVSATQIVIVSAVGGMAFAVTAPFALMSVAGTASQLGGALGALGGTVEGIGEEGMLINGSGAVDIGGELTTALPGLFSIGSMFAVIITFILGFIFFALIAGIVGASVSRIEDLGTALQPLMFMAVIGFMLAYMPSAMNYDGEVDGIITFSYFFPISSPFALPSAILMGNISPWETVISVAMLAVMTLLAALLTAKVYESMILYSGSRLKISQIVKMIKK